LETNPGSFRDPANQVYEIKPKSRGGKVRILRGLNKDVFDIYQQLSSKAFFRNFLDTSCVVKTKLIEADDQDAKHIIADGWEAVLEHETIPFVTYPYEWNFFMIKDAALLQLHLIEISLEMVLI